MVYMLSCLRFKNFIHWSSAVVTTPNLSSVVHAWNRVRLAVKESLRGVNDPPSKAPGNSSKAFWYASGVRIRKTRMKALRIRGSFCSEMN